MYFTEDQSAKIKEKIEQLEKNTGIELVTVVVDKCDVYPEIPWKAFALGVAFSAFAVTIHAFINPDWITVLREPLMAILVLGVGAVAALLTTFWPWFARLFLDRSRAALETEQHARSLFLEREIFNTRKRNGLMLLVGLFEHQVVALPDKGVSSRVEPESFQEVISAMRSGLRQGDRYQALITGLSTLEKRLITAGFKGVEGADDEIPDEFIQKKGAE
jgi:putative membrane protein